MPENRSAAVHAAAPRLLDRVRNAIRARHYSPRTEKAYVFWTRKFIVFHDRRHPDTMGEAEIKAFLSYLAVSRKVAASTQNQAFGALLFLYRNVLGRELQGLNDSVRAKRPIRIPIVLAQGEVAQVLRHLRGVHLLAALVMYGAGLRLLECLQLRVKDIDFERSEIIVRDGKGKKDRRSILPPHAAELLHDHLEAVQRQHAHDLEVGLGSVFLPDAIVRKLPGAATD